MPGVKHDADSIQRPISLFCLLNNRGRMEYESATTTRARARESPHSCSCLAGAIVAGSLVGLSLAVPTEARLLSIGAAMHTSKGTAHAFANPFEGPARALVVNAPDIGAQYFKEIAAVLGAGGSPDQVALTRVMGRYELVPNAPQ